MGDVGLDMLYAYATTGKIYHMESIMEGSDFQPFHFMAHIN